MARHRSHKIEELAREPHAEVCWYFTGTREQYRLAGKVLVVDKDSTDAVLLKVPHTPLPFPATKHCYHSWQLRGPEASTLPLCYQADVRQFTLVPICTELAACDQTFTFLSNSVQDPQSFLEHLEVFPLECVRCQILQTATPIPILSLDQ